MIAVDGFTPLVLLPLASLPWLARTLRRSGHPRLDSLPDDPLSRIISLGLRAAGAVAFAALSLGLAGLHLPGGHVERLGTGANIALVIDRSSSMDYSFADSAGGDQESKAQVARRLLTSFVARRPHDRLGVALFSTSPILAVPLTDRREVVKAAIAAIDEPGLSQTNVGRGLAMGFDMLGRDEATASRAVLLVSDGAAVIAPEVQQLLTTEAARNRVSLYWLYIRSAGSPSIFDPPSPGQVDSPVLRPERHLHLFLQRLGVPYRAFEAESPEAVEDAIAEIDRLESRPILYREATPRRDLATWCWGLAAMLLGLLAAARLASRPFAPGQAIAPAVKAQP
jgi:mxaC protein